MFGYGELFEYTILLFALAQLSKEKYIDRSAQGLYNKQITGFLHFAPDAKERFIYAVQWHKQEATVPASSSQ
jgi:hypothetical protein